MNLFVIKEKEPLAPFFILVDFVLDSRKHGLKTLTLNFEFRFVGLALYPRRARRDFYPLTFIPANAGQALYPLTFNPYPLMTINPHQHQKQMLLHL